MFELTRDEWKFLTSQFMIFEKGQGKGKYPKYLPFAFTEHGVTMLANVLKPKKRGKQVLPLLGLLLASNNWLLKRKTEINNSILNFFAQLWSFNIQKKGKNGGNKIYKSGSQLFISLSR